MKRSIQLDLLIIIILLFIINIPLLTGKTPIAWDTFSSPYEEFSITYNSVFLHSQLPLWLPYSYYGVPDYFWLIALSIVNFLFIGIGTLLNIHNTLLLFKVSLVGEQLIAVFGMYLLARQIFRKRTTVFIICLAFMTTFALYRQVQFNFRMTYLLPLILYWIVLFFQRKSPEFLWLGGITTVFSIPGSAFYPLVIELYSILIFSFIVLLFDLQALHSIFKFSWQSLAAFVSLIAISLIFYYYISSFNQGIDIMRTGRGENLSVPINEYLTNWKSWNPLALATSFLYGTVGYNITNAYEYVLYIGLIPLVGVIGSFLCHPKRRLWYAVLTTAIFLYGFSLRGYFSFIVYFLPFIDMTRYIAILGTVPFRMFLILLAGFGLDVEYSAAQWIKIGVMLLGCFLLVDVIGAITTTSTDYLEILSAPDKYSPDIKYFIYRVGGIFLLLSITGLIHYSQREKGQSIGPFSTQLLISFGLIIITIFDLGLYRYNFEKKIQEYLTFISRDQILVLPGIQPYDYQDFRLMNPNDTRKIQAGESTSTMQAAGPIVSESYLQFDRCIPEAVTERLTYEIFSSSLRPMVESGLVLISSENATPGLKQIYGCDYPKLRIVSNVQVRSTNQEALELIRNTNDFSNLLILSKEYSQETTSINKPVPKGDVQVVSFSANHLNVKVELEEDNAWLVYSDAYHPNWQVKVNNERKNIERAYLAFKAIPLTRGMNIVEFTYGTQFQNIGYSLLAILCGTVAFILFCFIPIIVIIGFKHPNTKEYKRPF